MDALDKIVSFFAQPDGDGKGPQAYIKVYNKYKHYIHQLQYAFSYPYPFDVHQMLNMKRFFFLPVRITSVKYWATNEQMNENQMNSIA